MHQATTQVVELATNLDDASGEVVGCAVRMLLQTPGVLDVWTTAIAMKHDRPGVMLSVLCEAEAAEPVADRVIELTGTFGVRHRRWERTVLDRRHEQVQTALGPVRVKLGERDGRVLVAKPELADVQALAEAHGVSVRRAMEMARAAAEPLLPRKGETP